MKKRLTVILIVVILLLAGFLRLWGTDFGLPFQYHPDEKYFFLPIEKLANWQPLDWYGAPGTTLVYLNGFFGYIIANLIDAQRPIQSFIDEDPTLFYLLPRIFLALIGTLSAFFIYLLTDKLFKNKKISLLAALCLTVSVMHVEHSHYVRPDVLAAFFLILVSYFSWLIYQKGKLKYYLLAGLFLALAVVTKYPAVLGVIFIILGHLFYTLKQKRKKIKDNFKMFFNKKIILAGFLTIIFFVIVFPYIILDFDQVIESVTREARTEHAGADSLNFWGNLNFYLSNYHWYVGTFIFIFAILGIIYSIVKAKNQFFFIVTYLVICIIFISSLALHWHRWTLILIPFTSILSGAGIYAFLRVLWYYLKEKWKVNTVVVKILFIIILCLIFYPPLLRSVRMSYSLAHDDTRDVTREWALENIPRDSSIVIEDYCPEIENDFEKVVDAWVAGKKYPLEWVQEEGAGYEIVSSWIYQRVFDGPDKWQDQKNSYLNLFNHFELVFHAYPGQDQIKKELIESADWKLIFSSDIFNFTMNAGPEIRIYKLWTETNP